MNRNQCNSSMNQGMGTSIGMSMCNSTWYPEDNKKNLSENEEINIIFRRSGRRTPEEIGNINVSCLGGDFIKDIIQKYRNKSGDYDSTEKFVYNAKALKPYLTVSESGLGKDANIFVVPTSYINGGGWGMLFCDIEKNKPKEIPLSKDAPDYRKIHKGINVVGICHNKRCIAFNSKSVSSFNKEKLDLLKDR